MLLAGGQGTRLKDLTTTIAKPAVHFGGKYRIIDFPLSNCTHSNIDTVGVLTQYEPLELNTYIGIGSAWDLDVEDGGVTILPPYISKSGKNWYTGTANAIYQNIKYMDLYDPEYVVILSGDHIYKMDYSEMLETHKQNNAELTIAVIEVPMEEAHRFGIMNTNDEMKIVEFQEKPKEPKSNLASMGIYIFSYATLKKYLALNEQDLENEFDFGKHVIPAVLDDGLNVFAHPFKGYWRDVGTISSLWETHMDLIERPNEVELFSPEWKILSKSFSSTPTYVDGGSQLKDSVICAGCDVCGDVIHSVIGEGCSIGCGSNVSNSVLMPGVSVGDDVKLDYCIVKEDVVIPNGFEFVGTIEDIELITQNTITEWEGK
jgi:glucose-1-phosphate adenylyltransferase